MLVAYLSVSKSVGQELTKKHKSARIQQIFHDSMCVVLEPLKEAGKDGMEVVFGDGYVRRVYPTSGKTVSAIIAISSYK